MIDKLFLTKFFFRLDVQRNWNLFQLQGQFWEDYDINFVDTNFMIVIEILASENVKISPPKMSFNCVAKESLESMIRSMCMAPLIKS